MENKNLKITSWVILLLSFVGFLDAAYLTIKKFFTSPLPCYIFQGCETVTTSPYSSIFGVPLSLLGAIFYLAIFIMIVRFFETNSSKYFKSVFFLAVLGFLMDIYLVYIQGFVLKTFCFYCVVSAIVSTLIFLLVLLYKWKLRVETRKV